MRRAAATMTLTATVLLLTSCAAEPAPTIPAGPPPTTTAAATTTAPAAFGDQTLSPRGNLVKTIGQPGAVSDAGIPVLEFRVDGIRPGVDCQAQGYSEDPENGQFVAVDVFAQTTSDFDPTSMDSSFLAYGWSLVTVDGRRHSVDTPAAFSCSPRSIDDLGGLTPGINVQGTVLLDAPQDLTGAVIVLNSGTVVDGGWEWPVPTA